MSSHLDVVGPVLDNATAGDLVDVITRRIADVPGALKLVLAHRADDDADGANEEQWGPVHPDEVLLGDQGDEVDGSDAMRSGPAVPAPPVGTDSRGGLIIARGA
jgi:hypothetical protein